MTARTPVWFASVGKTVTAAVALALADAGRLRLDDPVRRWVPETRLARSVTLRDLLRHTSGLRDPPERFWVRQYQSTSRRVAPRDWIAVMPPPDPDPGPAPGYENVNFVVAGIAMRRAAGRQWAQFRHRAAPGLVLQPDERVKGRPARSYVFDGARPRPYGGDARLIPSTSIATAAWTAGAWAGSVQRLARWADRLFGGEILRPGSLRDMTRFRPGASMWAGYGLGLARTREEGYETWGHTGDGPGMHAELWHLPRRRLTLATVWNDDLVDDPDIQRALLRTALAHL